MANKLVIIISSSEPGVAQAGMMYALNACKHCWMDDVKIFFFGPAQKLLTQDPELQRLLADYQAQAGIAVACKYLADRDDTAEQSAALGVQVAYVGSMISDLIKNGYIPMVW
jgi:hypothetical protein